MRQTILVILALAATAGTADAQAHRGATREKGPSRPGLVLNLHAFATPGFSIAGEDIFGAIKTSLGPGLGAQVGYAFGPRYMVFASFDVARLGATGGQTGHWGFGLFEVGGRMSFPMSNPRLMPYVSAAFGGGGIGAEVEDQGDVKFSGLVASAGGGLT